MIRRILLAAAPIACVVVGCNAILDNTPGTLVTTEEAGTEPAPDAGPAPPPAPSKTASTPPPPPKDGGADTGSPCAANEHLCNGACVDVADPRYGCGSPSCRPCVLPHATARCSAGACAIAACDKGFGDCDVRFETGCETDLSTAANCGACNTPCAAATPLCMPTAGTFQCSSGCPITAPILCGKDCVDPLSSVANCGGCNQACPDVPNATVTCSLATCKGTCKAGYHACAAACVPTTDVTACGPACTACPAVPNGKPACVADACAAICDAGFADCDALPANGCEARLATDPANCGVCGRACPPGLACVAGACAPGGPDAGR